MTTPIQSQLDEASQQRFAVASDSRVRTAATIRRVALLAPGWPPDAICNGVTGYVANLKTGLEHHHVQVQVLAAQTAGENHGAIDVTRFWSEIGPVTNVWARVLAKLGRHREWRLLRARHTLVPAVEQIRRTGALDLLEMEESFGLAEVVARFGHVPVVVKLHGPWFINAVAQNRPRDAEYHQRVADEGRAIAAAAGVSSPSLDVLNRTRNEYGMELPHAAVIPCSMVSRPRESHWRLDACDRKRIVFIGRFDNHKAGDVMIDAMARLLREDAELVLDFIGPDRGVTDGAGRVWNVNDYLADRVPEALRNRVTIHGPVANSELDGYRRRAMVTVVPSRYENFPYAVLEAMSVGAPIVTSDTGGIPEIIQHDRNGLLAKPGDADDLARNIGSLLRHPEHAARLAKQAAEDCASRYNPIVIAEQTLAFYQDVLGRIAKP
jgi:glycosyltransferase involved in cell wall biosynthesis